MAQTLEVAFKTDTTGPLNEEELINIKRVVAALIESGSLTGVKQGKTIIHWNAKGNFMGVELSYWPFRNREEFGQGH